ncbi:MAG TPA: hypothetical protein VI758_06750 [Bacteroidota bacterium]
MRRILLFISLVVSVPQLDAQFVTGRLTTSFYGWQGRDANDARLNFLRGYENVQLNASSGSFSFGTNFQISNDFATKLGTDPELRLSSFVLKARQIADVADVSLGRQFIFAGVGSGIMDGADLRLTFLGGKVGTQFYGGYNVVETRTLNWKKNLPNNSFLGAQITGTPLDNLLVGVSYMDRRRTPDAFKVVRLDSLFNPYDVILSSTPYEEEYASVDANYDVLSNVSVYGRGDYDVNLDRISRVELNTRVGVLSSLFVTMDILHREPRLAYNSIFAVFNSNSTQEVEGGVEYNITPAIRTFARYAYVDYRDDNSQRFTVGGSYDFLSASYTRNFGFAGDLNGVAVQAAYPLQDRTFVPMLAFGYGSYKVSPDASTNTVFNGSIGLTYRPMPSLSADVETQYMENRLYASDVRVFLKVNYWFSTRLD